MRLLSLVACVAVLSCAEKKQPEPRAKPRPLEPLVQATADAGGDRAALYEVVPLAPTGPAVPSGAGRVALAGERWGAVPESGPVVLVPDEDTFLVQISPLLEHLQRDRREVWLKHPEVEVAYRVTLRDETDFQAWLDELEPGKVRVIHRADGFELSTNMGKLPGVDANGPTVPVRGGKMDLTTLQRGFEKVRGRFKDAPDVCFVPSFGMELAQVARAMAANYERADAPYFEGLCLVYPRRPARP